MSRRTVMTAIIFAVFLVIFNMIFFMAGGTDREASVWITYAFIHVAYICIMVTQILGSKHGQMIELSMPALMISIAYFIAEFLLGIIIIAIAPEGVKLIIILQAILLGIYIVVFMSVAIANDATVEQTERQQAERVYVKKCSADLKGIMDKAPNQAVYKKIEKVYDFIHSSPIKSNNQVMEYEIEVFRLIYVLDKCVDTQNVSEIDKTIDEIMKNAGARNRMLQGQW